MAKEKVLVIKDLNNKILDEAYDKAVIKDPTYSDENRLIKSVLTRFPKNNNVEIVAMKAALIDVTNSTHLHQYKADINLLELARLLTRPQLDFDNRVKHGDESLVVDIAKNIGNKNLFSFASKYCFYHNSMIYKKDDYAKFDGIVKDCLPLYAQKYNVLYKNKKITTGTLETLRKTFNYSDFNKIVKETLNGITTTNKIAKFDAVMWYYNRSEQNKKDNV